MKQFLMVLIVVGSFGLGVIVNEIWSIDNHREEMQESINESYAKAYESVGAKPIGEAYLPECEYSSFWELEGGVWTPCWIEFTETQDRVSVGGQVMIKVKGKWFKEEHVFLYEDIDPIKTKREEIEAMVEANTEPSSTDKGVQ